MAANTLSVTGLTPMTCDPVDAEEEILGAFLDEALVGSSGALGRAAALYGVDLCGEGGEFHSIVVDCPLFSGPLELRTTKRKEGQYAYLECELL